MRGGQAHEVAWQWHRVFRGGTVAGFTEEQLLDRFLTNRDEIAFEALVARHGPMVLAVCRRMLSEPCDVDDAFQATFLIFVRRAGAIRNRERLGNWLYGVAHRVAIRARANTARRRSRETGGSETLVDSRARSSFSEEIAALHEEVRRLPEKYRSVVILCDLESRSLDDASRALGWPIGSVKGRLFRARNLLRVRLVRRGVSLTVGAISATLGHEVRASVVAPSLLDSTVKAGVGLAAGQSVATTLVSASSLALFQGVQHAMFLTKLKVAGALIAAGIVVAGSGVMAHQNARDGERPGEDIPSTTLENQTQSKNSPVAEDSSVFQKSMRPPGDATQRPDEIYRELAAAMHEYMRRRDLYEQGKLGIKSVIDASERLTAAEQDSEVWIARYPLDPDRQLQRMQQLAERERAKFRVGNGSAVDLEEAEIALLKARKSANPPRQAEPNATTSRTGANSAGSVAEDRSLELEDEVDEKLNELIRQALLKPMPMPFAQETPLGDVVKYIRTSTTSPEFPTGIPIYIDPKALDEEEKTIDSPVTFDMDGVRLKTSLRLMLRQLNLGYYIRDGLLFVTSLKSPDYPATPEKPSNSR